MVKNTLWRQTIWVWILACRLLCDHEKVNLSVLQIPPLSEDRDHDRFLCCVMQNKLKRAKCLKRRQMCNYHTHDACEDITTATQQPEQLTCPHSLQGLLKHAGIPTSLGAGTSSLVSAGAFTAITICSWKAWMLWISWYVTYASVNVSQGSLSRMLLTEEITDLW